MINTNFRPHSEDGLSNTHPMSTADYRVCEIRIYNIPTITVHQFRAIGFGTCMAVGQLFCGIVQQRVPPNYTTALVCRRVIH